eukprot:1664571-Amphidinium_carterae.1
MQRRQWDTQPRRTSQSESSRMLHVRYIRTTRTHRNAAERLSYRAPHPQPENQCAYIACYMCYIEGHQPTT